MSKSKKCFIITPIGKENSDVFRRAKGVIESVIKPILEGYGFKDIKPSYEINTSGMITTQIINRIIEDDLVIANLTDNNPNVMYELCLRHIVAKPIIHICENGSSLPFDIKDNRTIFYKNDMLGVEELKATISSFLDEIDYDKQYMDNPIYVAYKYGQLLQETQGTDTHRVIELLLNMSNQLTEIRNSSSQAYHPYGIMADIREKAEKELKATHDTELVRDVLSINKDEIENLLKMAEKTPSLRVHEIAKELNTTNTVILALAKLCNIETKHQMSVIKKNDVKIILDYIKRF